MRVGDLCRLNGPAWIREKPHDDYGFLDVLENDLVLVVDRGHILRRKFLEVLTTTGKLGWVRTELLELVEGTQ